MMLMLNLEARKQKTTVKLFYILLTAATRQNIRDVRLC